jgi:hypothetical protein
LANYRNNCLTTTLSYISLMAGGPWVWFISPGEMAMFVGLARDWLAFVVAIILSGEEDRVSDRKRDNKYRKWVTDQIKIGATKALMYLEKLMIQSLGTSRSRRRSQSSCRSTSRRSGGRQRDLLRRKQWARTSGMVVAMLVTTSQGRQAAAFDSDSFKLYVDNCASKCIANNIDDFVRAPQKVRGRVKSFDGNKVSVHAVGTIKWDFEDENGTAHSFLIPGSLYVPSAPARLFFPQHWAQEQKDHYPSKDGTNGDSENSEESSNSIRPTSHRSCPLQGARSIKSSEQYSMLPTKVSRRLSLSIQQWSRTTKKIGSTRTTTTTTRRATMRVNQAQQIEKQHHRQSISSRTDPSETGTPIKTELPQPQTRDTIKPGRTRRRTSFSKHVTWSKKPTLQSWTALVSRRQQK